MQIKPCCNFVLVLFMSNVLKICNIPSLWNRSRKCKWRRNHWGEIKPICCKKDVILIYTEQKRKYRLLLLQQFLYSNQNVQFKRKGKKSDSVLWQKPLHRHKNQKGNTTTKKRHQKLRLHNDCRPTFKKTVSRGNHSHSTGLVKPVYGIPTLLNN